MQVFCQMALTALQRNQALSLSLQTVLALWRILYICVILQTIIFSSLLPKFVPSQNIKWEKKDKP